MWCGALMGSAERRNAQSCLPKLVKIGCDNIEVCVIGVELDIEMT